MSEESAGSVSVLTNTGELAKALAAFQAEVQEPKRTAKNAHFRSSYATLADVLAVVRPCLAKHGLSVYQAPVSAAEGYVGVETILLHSSGESIRSIFAMPLSKRDAQGVGSALTYARRYALQAVTGVAAEDDDAESAVGRGDGSSSPKG